MRFSLLLTGSIIFLVQLYCWAQLSVPHHFSDNMVLQREKPIHIWGWGNPQTKVTVTFNELQLTTKVNEDGSWKIQFPAMQASFRPQSLVISDDQSQISISNILIGDIWVCSGQSNMEWSIERFKYAQEESATKLPALRMFTVHKDPAAENREVSPGGSWKMAQGDHILGFSATAYFFGKELFEKVNIPIGLIASSWGGTVIEAWIPPAQWANFPSIQKIYTQQNEVLKTLNIPAQKEAFHAILEKNVYNGIGLNEQWQLPQTKTTDWETISIPQEKNNALFESRDGAVWFRKQFEVPLPFRGKNLKANLGKMNDHDMVWVNGHKIGESLRKSDWRNYTIKAEYLRPGQNEIVIRVFDYGQDGGYVTDPYFINIHPVGDKKGYYLLSGDWKYKIGKELTSPLDLPKSVPNKRNVANSTPSSLYHSMIHPFRNLGIKGFVWYQGESNTLRGYEYQHLFKLLINGWRSNFQQGDLPFLFVQLPNFEGKSNRTDPPQLSNWPELRFAQAKALELPNTGMAVTLDLGESKNIHPSNKQDVGKRLVRCALNLAYQKTTPYLGPTLVKKQIDKQSIILEFDHTGEGLQSISPQGENGFVINHFKISDSQGAFYPAFAQIIGPNKVKVWSKQVTSPKDVQYAWENDPKHAKLFNSYGLPAAPFRTDQWEWQTRENTYNVSIK